MAALSREGSVLVRRRGRGRPASWRVAFTLLLFAAAGG
ncbi:hypothetical protein HMPREF1315_1213, partial [Bifidobacterium longum subsp. longum 2-2B]